jgi:hypothetical protein
MKQKFTIFILILFSSLLGLNAQGKKDGENTITVTGTVKNEKEQKLKGVRVLLRNTNFDFTNGSMLVETFSATTNMVGKYSIKAENNDSLIFSKEGYWPITIPVDNRSKINVTLQEMDMGKQYLIIGIVRDDAGNILTGITVLQRSLQMMHNGELEEKATPITVTDGRGEFRTVPYEKVNLIFSMSGYETIEVPVSELMDKDDIVITMKKMKL